MIRVFIYDDNESRRESLIALIQLSENMEYVGSGKNCEHALEDMKNCKPDIVLMDIEMPVVDGIDGVRIIKKQFPEIKIIMQTVYEDSTKIFAALQNGAEGYILKKASINAILESINEVYNGGAFMTPSVALQVMKYFNKADKIENKLNHLTTKENEVLELLTDGLSYKMIGDKMNISYGTVNNHLKKIYEKLQVHSAGEAVSLVYKNKLI